MNVTLFLVVLCCVSFVVIDANGKEGHIKNSFYAVQKNFYELQAILDAKVPRDKQVGHTGWLTNMCSYYWNQAHLSHAKTICEVGFGVGFTSTIWLTAGDATVYSFDLFPEEGKVVPSEEMGYFVNYMAAYQNAGIRFLQEKFPGRFHPIKGYSDKTIPAFAKANSSVKCDIILVDGSHTTEGTLVDFRNFKALAHKDTTVFIDDLEDPNVSNAVALAQKEGILTPTMTECIRGEKYINPDFGHPGVTVKEGETGKHYCRTHYQF
uniref:Uncharacterized protein n=1 Tax=Spumella elongata TaxID=89044 RepID=A0A7S3H906_9STRA|mmetsp:Transcript_39104/g.67703  ORF Transcript_39104/g.67703 Transcript_39104/m.67703 type:complete len:265 (+) Transcript_39104:59-853(+)